ncbi:helix-turn-helix domain-containing protein [Calderihabitans maritimus]|uniref:Helix-turn-helix domain-containing protein n=1 Tax=Calderihabitans maritimus TaxID=1246530 RepID=A0A1Z5HNH0_9FIRM|nr:helix-turn-helix domain-containing protein [Calderihabitans maritimus]GAW91066.1 helix-turn-helix domain-containing protein [Calderihabitans maritimus]
MSLGSKIRDFRKERGLTLAQLGEKINVSASYISSIERDLKKPTIPMLKKISDALNIPITYLLIETADIVTGEKLKLVREGRNLTIEELAEISEVPAESIRRFEEGTAQPTLEQLEKLSEALNVTIRYFLERSTGRSTTLGERVRAARKKQGMSITVLAERAGVSPGLISQIENNQTLPPLDTLEKIARALNTSVYYFLLEQEDVADLLSSLNRDLIELLGDPRVQAVLRTIRDFDTNELQYILNYIQFFKKHRSLLS